MSNLQSSTNYSKSYVNCGSYTDVVWRKRTGVSWRGLYDCVLSNGKCRKSIIYMNPNQLNDQRNKDKTACHEIGHSVGLTHAGPDDDCMISGQVNSGGFRVYSIHRIFNHINPQS